MHKEFVNKLKSNINIYKKDIESKGLYWSIIHRLYKLPQGRKIASPIVNYTKPNYLKIDGSKFYIDKRDTVVSQELLITGKWEDYETELFKKNVKKGNVVVDIGAHIGYYTIIAAKIVGKKGKVYSFEPDPKNFSILKKNVEKNGYKNVILINKAVTDFEGETKLYLNKYNTGDHRIYKSKDHKKIVKVKTTKLDTIFKTTSKVDIIKIDIQGAEVQAFKGARKMLSKNKNIKILTEFWPLGLKLCGTSAKEYADLLTRNKFKIFEIDEDAKSIKPLESKKLLDLCEFNAPEFKNLFCTRNS